MCRVGGVQVCRVGGVQVCRVGGVQAGRVWKGVKEKKYRMEGRGGVWVE